MPDVPQTVPIGSHRLKEQLTPPTHPHTTVGQHDALEREIEIFDPSVHDKNHPVQSQICPIAKLSMGRQLPMRPANEVGALP